MTPVDRGKGASRLAASAAAEMTRKALAFGATQPKPEAAREVAAALAAEAVAAVRERPA